MAGNEDMQYTGQFIPADSPDEMQSGDVQLSFVVTKYWDRPEGESGFTEQTCSQASFRRVLTWMLEELPPESVIITRELGALNGEGPEAFLINWLRVPDGILKPVITPRPAAADENAAAVARVRDRLERVVDDASGRPMINAKQILDLLDPQGMWTYSFTTPVPEPGEPS